MKKASLLFQLQELKTQMEDEEIKEITKIKILDLLLDYINDVDIRGAVEDIPI
ncbi:MAG TPA: hypothetical protein VNX68_15700 [Nitrosopumilaceae archaeon]|jgi:hypothetical protein|nr:hypothetical protein [Nitrosopumilaceae archaeon]